MVLLNILTDS